MQRILAVLVMLMIIFTLLLSNSIAVEKSKGEKEKTKTSKQKQPMMKMAPVEKYDFNRFNLSSSYLPPNYMGHDLKSIAEALEERKGHAKKDEYETTEQYKQRIQDEEHKPLIDTLTLDDIFSFVVFPESKYDADTQTLTLMVKATILGDQYKNDWLMVAIHGPDLYRLKNTYIGSNAYGAETEIEKLRVIDIQLAFSNKSGLPLNYSYNLPEAFKFDLENITPETAKAIRNHLYMAFIYQLKEPYFSESYSMIEPTRDEPKDYFWSHKNILTLLKEIWVFNKTNGEILLKLKTDDAKIKDTPRLFEPKIHHKRLLLE